MPNPNPDAKTAPLISRRTLLGAAALVLLPIAAHANKQEARLSKALSYPPADTYPPGTLAKSRLGERGMALLKNANHFSALRGKLLFFPSDTKPGKTTTVRVSPEFPAPVKGAATPDPQETLMAKRLAPLLLNDGIWTDEWETNPHFIDFEPDFVFRLGDAFGEMTLSLCPRHYTMELMWKDYDAAPTTHIARLLFDPVGKEMTALIKEAFPRDANAQSLAFGPEPAAARSALVRPASVSVQTWNDILALAPGMTRARLNRWFDGQGGMAGRLFQGFYAKEVGGPHRGPYLTMAVKFAPCDVPLLWRNGRGFFLNPDDETKAEKEPERPDDIITYLSPYQWSGGLVMD